MNMITRVGWIAGAMALVVTAASEAQPAGDDDLAKRLETAEARLAATYSKIAASDAKIASSDAKIATLEAVNNQNWLTEQRSAEIKGLVQDVLADADTRSSLLQSGATSGYDNGFIVGSADGNWLLRINFLMQQRFIWNNKDTPTPGQGDNATEFDETRYGFENTRSTLTLSGHLVNPSWFYRLDVNFGSNSITPDALEPAESDLAEFAPFHDHIILPFGESAAGRRGTLNAYLGYDFGNGWRVKAGTMKLPFLREELVEAQYQLAVERSVLGYGFTTGYSDGVAFDWTGERFRAMGMFSDGVNLGQTIWINGPLGESGVSNSLWHYAPGAHAEWALTGRAEYMVSGTWEQFEDFTSPKGGETGILIGAAIHYQQLEEIPNSTVELNQLRLTGDVSLEFGGWNLYSAVVWTDNDFGGSGSLNPWGWLIQGGFYLNETWELYGRFEWIEFDEVVFSDAADTQILTVGVNKYFAGHNAKWTTDFGYGFNPSYNTATITGWRSDDDNADGQWVFRTQVQIYF